MSVMRCDRCERFVDTDFEEVEWGDVGCTCQRCAETIDIYEGEPINLYGEGADNAS